VEARASALASDTLFTREFVLATASNLVFFTGVTTFFVLPVHMEELGASRAEVGHVMGAFGLMTMVGIPTTGHLVDRLGRRPFMVMGAFTWAIAATLFSFVRELGAPFFMLRMLQGAAFAMAFTATNVLVSDLAPEGTLGRAISILGVTTLVTHALGPAVGEIVLHTLGFRVLCLGSAAFALLAVALQLRVTETRARQGDGKPSPPGPSFVSLAARRGAASALFGGLTSALAFGSALNFMPTFVHSRKLPSFAAFFVAYVVSAIAVRLAAGGLGDRSGHRRVAIFSLAGFAVVVSALSLVHSTTSLVLLGLGFGVSHGWAYPSLNALFVSGAPAAARGRAMSLYNLAFNVGVTLAAFSGGELAERFGYSAMWLVMGGLSSLGVVALLADSRE
jgi:MFS family permease